MGRQGRTKLFRKITRTTTRRYHIDLLCLCGRVFSCSLLYACVSLLLSCSVLAVDTSEARTEKLTSHRTCRHPHRTSRHQHDGMKNQEKSCVERVRVCICPAYIQDRLGDITLTMVLM